MDTGNVERPPPRPPDRAALNTVVQSQTADNMVMHLGAENANDPPQNGVDPMNIPNPAVTAVTCEAAAKQSNALHSPLLHFESSVFDRGDFKSSAKRNSNSKGKNPGTIQQKGLSTSSGDAAAQHRTYASAKRSYYNLFEGYPSIIERERLSCLLRLHRVTMPLPDSSSELPTLVSAPNFDKALFEGPKRSYYNLFEGYPSIIEQEQLSCLLRLHRVTMPPPDSSSVLPTLVSAPNFDKALFEGPKRS
jgi:hypothetical protein